MSEDNFEVDTNFESEAEPEQQEESQEEVQDKKDNTGWMDRKTWEESGKDPDEWRSKKTHDDFAGLVQANSRMHQKVDHIEKTHAYDMKNMQTYHSAQLSQQYNKLNTERLEAIEVADTDQVKKIEQQMGNIQQQATAISPQQTQNNQDLADWYNNIVSSVPGKEVEIENAIAGAIQRNPGNLTAIADDVELYVKKLAPKPLTNPRRNAPSVASSSNARSGKNISMGDITAEEKEMRAYFKDDKSFLNAVKTTRSSK